MSSAADDLRSDIATLARAFSRLKYVHAFGHVSARLEHSLLITPTKPALAALRPSEVIEVDLEGRVVSGDSSVRPIEVFLHVGLYMGRPDVRAVCRTHAPYASTWPGDGKAPPILHGFGGMARTVATYDACDLVHTPTLGVEAASVLGGADAMILRGNGAVTVGRSLSEAAARMWSLEERCAQAWRQGSHRTPFTDADLTARSRWYAAESERIWMWLKYLGSNDSLGRHDGH